MLIIALLSLWLLNGYSIDFNEDRIIKFINNKPYENGYKKFSLFHVSLKSESIFTKFLFTIEASS